MRSARKMDGRLLSDGLRPLIDFSHVTYSSVLGDTPKSDFIFIMLPLLYVTLLPLLNVTRILFCPCEPSVVAAASWPPKPEKASNRGKRIVRRLMDTTGAFKAAGKSQAAKNKLPAPSRLPNPGSKV